MQRKEPSLWTVPSRFSSEISSARTPPHPSPAAAFLPPSNAPPSTRCAAVAAESSFGLPPAHFPPFLSRTFRHAIGLSRSGSPFSAHSIAPPILFSFLHCSCPLFLLGGLISSGQQRNLSSSPPAAPPPRPFPFPSPSTHPSPPSTPSPNSIFLALVANCNVQRVSSVTSLNGQTVTIIMVLPPSFAPGPPKHSESR